MRPMFTKTIAASELAAILRERHAKQFAKQRNKCIYKILQLADGPTNPFTAAEMANLPCFSSIDNPAGYNDRCPTAGYLLAIFKRYSELLRPYQLMTIQQNGIPPTLQIDHSKKIVKHLAQHHGEPFFSSLFTAVCSSTGKVRYVHAYAHTHMPVRSITWRPQDVHLRQYGGEITNRVDFRGGEEERHCNGHAIWARDDCNRQRSRRPRFFD